MPRRGDNIRKRADGRWEGRYRCIQNKGTGKYQSVYGRTYREVKEKLECVKQKVQSEVLELEVLPEKEYVSRKESLEFCLIMEEWLTQVKLTRKYSTYVKYQGIYQCHIKEALAGIHISDIDTQVISERIFLQNGSQKIISSSIQKGIYCTIKQTLVYASEHYSCPVNSLKSKVTKEKSKPVEIMNHSEQSRLFPFLYKDMDRSKLGIVLCLTTGLRLGEICALKWADIDLQQMIIHVNRTVQRIAVTDAQTKTILLETLPKSIYSIREIPISDQVAALLLRYHNNEEYCLCGTKPMEPRTYQNRFKSYLRAIGAPNYNFHALRHTFATNCIDHGMDVKSLSEILGHSDVQITLNRYVHPTMDTKRKHINTLSTIYGQYCGQTSKFLDNKRINSNFSQNI